MGIGSLLNIKIKQIKKIFFVEYENQADLKVYFVNYKNQAGWRNKNKSHLMY
ncbi:MAG: hypothetical protein UZ04_CHB001001193 [Chlorobi bacterium OLB4]|nr:MAG: hypothetical protein UZ04_CHB001001193 [Chlorobi bacterium OLB4]